jgi:hypothetical protein
MVADVRRHCRSLMGTSIAVIDTPAIARTLAPLQERLKLPRFDGRVGG